MFLNCTEKWNEDSKNKEVLLVYIFIPRTLMEGQSTTKL
jgi:hypothetical protein